MEGRAIVANQRGKGTARKDWIDQILLGPFHIQKEKQFIFQNRAAEIAAELIALKIIVAAAG